MDNKDLKHFLAYFTTINTACKIMNVYEKDNRKIKSNRKIIKLSKSAIKELKSEHPNTTLIKDIILKTAKASIKKNINQDLIKMV